MCPAFGRFSEETVGWPVFLWLIENCWQWDMASIWKTRERLNNIPLEQCDGGIGMLFSTANPPGNFIKENLITEKVKGIWQWDFVFWHWSTLCRGQAETLVSNYERRTADCCNGTLRRLFRAKKKIFHLVKVTSKMWFYFWVGGVCKLPKSHFKSILYVISAQHVLTQPWILVWLV